MKHGLCQKGHDPYHTAYMMFFGPPLGAMDQISNMCQMDLFGSFCVETSVQKRAIFVLVVGGTAPWRVWKTHVPPQVSCFILHHWI